MRGRFGLAGRSRELLARNHAVIPDKPPSGPAFGRLKDGRRGADPESIEA